MLTTRTTYRYRQIRAVVMPILGQPVTHKTRDILAQLESIRLCFEKGRNGRIFTG